MVFILIYRVYSWGWGVHGQLGHGNPEDCLIPKKIEALSDKHVTSLSGGYCHSLALTSQVGLRGKRFIYRMEI
jgi:alpha-tubulin suppressor-like RCC1 family protein